MSTVEVRVEDQPCEIRDCGRAGFARVDGIVACNPHYLRFHRHGDFQAHVPIGKARSRSASQRRADERSLALSKPTSRRELLRSALVGYTWYENYPIPGPDDDDYRTMPGCGNQGCVCPPVAEVDRLLDRLVKL